MQESLTHFKKIIKIYKGVNVKNQTMIGGITLGTNVIILEDDFVQINGLKHHIKEYDSSAVIHEYDNADSCFSFLEKCEDVVHLFLLDIAIGNQKNNVGISLAKSIRAMPKYKDTPIIFITGYSDFVFDAINTIHCTSYITKPYSQEQLTEQLKTALQKNNLRLRKPGGTFYNIDFSNIIYISSDGRTIQYHTTKDTFTSSTYRLKELSGLLPDNFLRIHKSYIINKNFLRNYSFTDGFVVLEGEITLPIGRSYTIY